MLLNLDCEVILQIQASHLLAYGMLVVKHLDLVLGGQLLVASEFSFGLAHVARFQLAKLLPSDVCLCERVRQQDTMHWEIQL